MVIRLFGGCLAIFGRKEVRQMAVIYVTLIVKGKRTYADIPEVIKPKVRELLTDLELEDLITD